VQIYASLGYDDVIARDFDLIVSNIPGKAGASVISSLLQNARYFLRPGGLVAVVVVAPLEALVVETLNAADADIVFHEARPQHVIFHYRFSGGPGQDRPERNAFDRDVYLQENLAISFRDVEFSLQTAWGLPEAESIGPQSRLLMTGLLALEATHPERVVLFNAGQGYMPVAAWTLLAPDEIVLVDRDLLSLRYSHRNLVHNECPGQNITLLHQAGILPPNGELADLVIGTLREDDTQPIALLTLKQAAQQLAPNGTILLAVSSTAATRLTKQIQSEKSLQIKDRKRSKGSSLLILGLK
ncbi:MAG: hypothetical protein A2Y73_08040, partial [Chloroflexi bacterium RBG_13_56_8]